MKQKSLPFQLRLAAVQPKIVPAVSRIPKPNSTPFMKTRVLVAFVLASGLALFCTPSAKAITNNTWTGGGADANWLTTANWSGGTVLTSNLLVFDGNTKTTNSNNTALASVSGILFNPTAGAFIIGGNAFNPGSSITDNSTNTETISNALTFSVGQTTMVVTGGNLILSGNLGASSQAWTKTGGGTLTLSGSNTAYTGAISLTQGTLLLDLATNTTGVLGSAQAINFGGGTSLSVKGAASGSSSQSFSNNLGLPTKGAVGITVNGNGGGGTTLTFSGVTHGGGSSLNATLASAGDALKFTAAPSNSNGIVPWATVTDSTGTGFGTASGTSLIRYTGATDLANGTTSTTNYKTANSTSSISLTGTNTVNSLSIDTTDGGGGTINVAAGGALAFNAAGSGVLVSGNNNYTIGGGNFQIGAGEVYLHQMGTGVLTINAPLSTASASVLVKDGLGTVILGSAASTIAGGSLYISGGVLELDNSSALTAGGNQVKVNVGINGGLTFGNGITSARIGDLTGAAGTGNIVLNNTTGGAVALLDVGVGVTTYAAVMSGSGSFEKQGGGNLTLSGANTYTGGTTISGAGIVTLSAANVLPSATTVTIGTVASGTLDMRASQTITGLSNGSFSGSVINQGGSTATLTITGGGTFGGSIGVGTSNKIALTKSNTGTLTLTGTNNYNGVTTVTGGGLQFGQQVSLYGGSTASWTAANITVNSGATLALNVGGAGEFTTGNIDALKVLGTGTSGFKSGSILGFDTSNASGGSFSYTSAIGNTNGGANALGVAKLGTGTLTLSGANTYTGGTAVSAGTLQFAQTNAMPASGAVAVGTGATLAVNAGGTGEFSNATSGAGSIGGLLAGTGGQGAAVTYTGAVALGIDTTNASGTLTYSGVIANVGTTLGVTKFGTGTLALGTSASPVTQTYTGATLVTSGTLLVNGTLQNGGVTVGSGATLGGNITAGGTTTIQSGGTLSVGNSPGTGNFATLSLAGTNIMQFNGAASRSLPGTDYDTINITTDLTYGGELRLTFAGAIANDFVNPFDLFAFGSIVPTGNFATVSIYNGAGFVANLTDSSGVWSGVTDIGTGLQTFTFTQATGDLMIVPEPSTYGMFIGGLTLFGFMALRRRRRHLS